jgi:hypothetical protein
VILINLKKLFMAFKKKKTRPVILAFSRRRGGVWRDRGTGIKT